MQGFHRTESLAQIVPRHCSLARLAHRASMVSPRGRSLSTCLMGYVDLIARERGLLEIRGALAPEESGNSERLASFYCRLGFTVEDGQIVQWLIRFPFNEYTADKKKEVFGGIVSTGAGAGLALALLCGLWQIGVAVIAWLSLTVRNVEDLELDFEAPAQAS